MATWILAQSVIPSLTAKTLVEIVILGLLLYQVVRMFQGAQASHFQVWMSVLAVLYLVLEWGFSTS